MGHCVLLCHSLYEADPAGCEALAAELPHCTVQGLQGSAGNLASNARHGSGGLTTLSYTMEADQLAQLVAYQFQSHPANWLLLASNGDPVLPMHLE